MGLPLAPGAAPLDQVAPDAVTVVLHLLRAQFGQKRAASEQPARVVAAMPLVVVSAGNGRLYGPTGTAWEVPIQVDAYASTRPESRELCAAAVAVLRRAWLRHTQTPAGAIVTITAAEGPQHVRQPDQLDDFARHLATVTAVVVPA